KRQSGVRQAMLVRTPVQDGAWRPRRLRMTLDPPDVIRAARRAGNVRGSAMERAIGAAHRVADEHPTSATLSIRSTKTKGAFQWSHVSKISPSALARIHWAIP